MRYNWFFVNGCERMHFNFIISSAFIIIYVIMINTLFVIELKVTSGVPHHIGSISAKLTARPCRSGKFLKSGSKPLCMFVCIHLCMHACIKIYGNLTYTLVNPVPIRHSSTYRRKTCHLS